MKIFFKAFFFTAIVMITVSCSQQNNLAKYNLAPNYVDQFAGRLMSQQIYHVNDSLSELSLRIVPSQIPNLKSKQVELYSYLTLTYSVYNSMNKKDLVQTDTYNLSELLAFEDMDEGVIKMTIPLKIKQNENYVVLVSVQNPMDQQNYLSFNHIFKTKYAAENYKILDDNDQIIWTNWIKTGQQIKIQYRYQDASKIFLSYYKPQFGPAIPPFSEHVNKDFFIDKPFEQFQLQLTNGKTASIELPHDGLFKIHSGTADHSGKTMLKLYDDFPAVVSPSQKVFGLRYLTPQKEFALMLKDDPEYTVKEFWFFEERSKDRSEEMMQTYYARMLRANRLFTNYKEGWKTDRGMIFMVYGPPDQVYYELDKEIWEYGPDASYNDLRFVFHKMASNFIQNEMVLERNSDYKLSWYRLLDHWRNEE